jgi:cell division protein FtsL
MSLNVGHNSNLSLVKSFHTMKKLEKCVNFILILPVFFFATNCTYLLTENYQVEI